MQAAVDDLIDRLVAPSFSRIGYALRSPGFEPLPRLDGRTVVLTGPTSGIGKAAAAGFAELGASLVLVGRDRGRLEAVVRELDLGSYRIEVADLSSLSDVQALADRLDASMVDVLVHNAGAMFDEHGRTSDGIERTLALNLVGPYLLTERLLLGGLPADARVVLVSSGGMYAARVSLEDQRRADGYRPALAYARAKRGQVVLVEAWTSRHPAGPTFHAMHPGWVDTPGVETSLPRFRQLVGPALRTPEEGADTILWLAGAEEPVAEPGGFWLDRRRRATHRIPRTRESEDERADFIRDLAGLSGIGHA
jgi:dehydrogenase/reductase SDR family member 12